MKNVIFHIDMDAFFASCEEAINPSYRGKPLIVGGKKGDVRAIVACPNYIARKRGVRTAMPLAQAVKLVPDGIFIRGTRGLYKDFSEKVMQILNKYSPIIKQTSIDEAYMDVTNVLSGYDNNPVKLAKTIKEEIKNTLNITCSIGIATSKVYAKIASKINKPDGITYVPFGKEKEFLSKLEIQRIPGVGKSTLEIFKRYNINFIGDVLKYNRSFFEKELGLDYDYFRSIAEGTYQKGISIEEEERKSLSKEHTFNEDTNDLKFLDEQLFSLLEKAANRLRKNRLKAKTLTIKVKYDDFSVNQKSYTFNKYSNLEFDFYDKAYSLLKNLIHKKKKIRLLGVKFSELCSIDATQGDLFENEEKLESLTEKLDSLREKYKFDIIKFGKNF
ncbi:MAG: DNA polymerase IV [Ignavibacteria bacterium]|nr:DNA polymerase IV [Ignavibacteria bacterium]